MLAEVVFEDPDEAIAIANGSEYGMIPSIYTRDLNVALPGCQEPECKGTDQRMHTVLVDVRTFVDRRK